MVVPPAGFRENEHTADWELEVWAPDLATLLEQAARGMYWLAGARLKSGPRQRRFLQLSAADAEGLLIRFLQELLYLGETEGLGFDQFEIGVSNHSLRAELGGAPIEQIEKEIKAVTYHKLAIQHRPEGLYTRIVFDV